MTTSDERVGDAIRRTVQRWALNNLGNARGEAIDRAGPNVVVDDQALLAILAVAFLGGFHIATLVALRDVELARAMVPQLDVSSGYGDSPSSRAIIDSDVAHLVDRLREALG